LFRGEAWRECEWTEGEQGIQGGEEWTDSQRNGMLDEDEVNGLSGGGLSEGGGVGGSVGASHQSSGGFLDSPGLSPPMAVLAGGGYSVYSGAFSPDGRAVLTGGTDNKVTLWDVGTRQPVRRLVGHGGAVLSVAFAPVTGEREKKDKGEGRTWYEVATGSQDKTARLWTVDASADGVQGSVEAGLVLKGHQGTVSSVAFSPNGRMLATASWDRTARIWERHTGACLQTLQGHVDFLGVCFTCDSLAVATASQDKTCRVWAAVKAKDEEVGEGKAEEEEEYVEGEEPKLGVGQVVFECRKVLGGHRDVVIAVSCSPTDKNVLATASYDTEVRVWDVSKGTCTAVVKGHVHWVSAIQFAPTGLYFATSCLDGTAKVWDLRGRCVLLLNAHSDGARSVAFSPDSRRLLTTSQEGDSNIRIFRLALGSASGSATSPRMSAVGVSSPSFQSSVHINGNEDDEVREIASRELGSPEVSGASAGVHEGAGRPSTVGAGRASRSTATARSSGAADRQGAGSRGSREPMRAERSMDRSLGVRDHSSREFIHDRDMRDRDRVSPSNSTRSVMAAEVRDMLERERVMWKESMNGLDQYVFETRNMMDGSLAEIANRLDAMEERMNGRGGASAGPTPPFQGEEEQTMAAQHHNHVMDGLDAVFLGVQGLEGRMAALEDRIYLSTPGVVDTFQGNQLAPIHAIEEHGARSRPSTAGKTTERARLGLYASPARREVHTGELLGESVAHAPSAPGTPSPTQEATGAATAWPLRSPSRRWIDGQALAVACGFLVLGIELGRRLQAPPK